MAPIVATKPVELPFAMTGERLYVVAGNKPQANVWMRELGIATQWTYISSPAAVRDRHSASIIYAGTWSTQAAALEIYESLQWVVGERYTCGEAWEDEQEMFLYELRLNLERAKREMSAASDAFSHGLDDYTTERGRRQMALVLSERASK